jgi:hypothetical protein
MVGRSQPMVRLAQLLTMSEVDWLRLGKVLNACFGSAFSCEVRGGVGDAEIDKGCDGSGELFFLFGLF